MTELDLLRKAVAVHSDKIEQLKKDLEKAFRLIQQLQQGQK
ncbi:hypothetical protein [Bradyrhizobium neotropicale]|nr:hypothetical protein [Bradyrhizobium neotropicale]